MKKIVGWLLIFAIVCGFLQPVQAHAASQDPCGEGCTLQGKIELQGTTSGQRIVFYVYDCGYTQNNI